MQIGPRHPVKRGDVGFYWYISELSQLDGFQPSGEATCYSPQLLEVDTTGLHLRITSSGR